MSRKIVIALGGNALGKTPEDQKKSVKLTSKSIVDLIQGGDQVLISHGNGPQVGMINLAMDAASKSQAGTPEMPFPECGAMSQGYIGYHLQNAIQNELRTRGIERSVATLITQVLVTKDDPAFQNPTKPIGSFYGKEEADAMTIGGVVFKEDAGRGYRRVVPSPKPVHIVEIELIKALIDTGNILIAGGGGGIPVVEEEGRLIGVSAVIDKDFTSAKLADSVGADILVILTEVEQVSINFGQPGEVGFSKLRVEEAKKHIALKEFAEGSMLPKVEAAISFVESKPGRRALITSLEKAAQGLRGQTGTWIDK